MNTFPECLEVGQPVRIPFGILGIVLTLIIVAVAVWSLS